MDKVLIDTDIILDLFFDRKPYSDYAATVFSLCESKKIHGFVTPVILSNVYYLLRKNNGHDKVLEKLNLLLSITDVLLMDRKIIVQAINSKFADFEDALQNYAAENDQNIDVILTRNTKDFRNSKLGILTPEEYVKTKK